MKLSDAQVYVLSHVARFGRTAHINSRTGFSLCRLGLLECYEDLVIGRDIICGRGRHPQFRAPVANPFVSRDWWITEAGRSALAARLSQGGDSDG